MKKHLILFAITIMISSINLQSAEEKIVVAEYLDQNDVLYVKYEGESNWTAIANKISANPLLTGEAEPGVNVFVDHGTIAIEYYDNTNMFGNERVKDLNKLETSQDFEMNSVSVFPNPASEVMGMEFMLESDGVVEIEIFDYSGKVVKNVQRTENNVGLNVLSIDISDLPNSEYYVSLKVHDKKVIKLVYFR